MPEYCQDSVQSPWQISIDTLFAVKTLQHRFTYPDCAYINYIFSTIGNIITNNLVLIAKVVT
ncbi:hypothetical protein TUM4433_29410 [Shewanella schlegeliana]|nr:hypothetical protein TUM4433_29410 [Shewanella schlegeliana]